MVRVMARQQQNERQMQSLPNYFHAPQRRALKPARPYSRRSDRNTQTRQIMTLARPLENNTNETGQFMSALVGFLRRHGYLPGTENGYQPANDSAVIFYRLGRSDQRLSLRRDLEPWTITSATRDANGIWHSDSEPQAVRDFVVELQTSANEMAGGKHGDIWPMFGSALNDALRKSYGWVARLEHTSADGSQQVIMIGSEATGVQCRLTLAIGGDKTGDATLEMLSHGEPSEWLPLDSARISDLVRTKDRIQAVATFLRLA